MTPVSHSHWGRRRALWTAAGAVASVVAVAAAVSLGADGGSGGHAEHAATGDGDRAVTHRGASDAGHGPGADGAHTSPAGEMAPVVVTRRVPLSGGGVARVQVIGEAAKGESAPAAGTPVTIRMTLPGAPAGRPALLAGADRAPLAPLERHESLLVDRRSGRVSIPIGAHGHEPGRGLASAMPNARLAWTTKVPPGAEQVDLDPEGRRLVLARPSAGSVDVVDVLRRTPARTLAVGGAPGPFAFEPSGGRIWVPDRRRPVVTVVDLAAARVASRIEVSGVVRHIAFDRRGAIAALSTDDGLHVVDVRTGGAVRVQSGTAGGRVAWVPALDGFAVADGDAQVKLVPADPSLPSRVLARDVTASGGLLTAPDGATLAALGDGPRALSVVDARSGAVARVDAGPAPEDLRLLGRFALVRSRTTGTVTWADLETPARSNEITIGARPAAALTIDPRGGALVTMPAEGRAATVHVMHGRPMLMEQARTPAPADVVFGMSSRASRVGARVYEQRTLFEDAGRHRVRLRVPAHGHGTFWLTVASGEGPQARATPVAKRVSVREGQDARVRFAVAGAKPGDAAVLAYSFGSGGIRQLRAPARQAGDGVYEAVVQAPPAGTYRVFLLSEQAGLTARTGRFAVLSVRAR